MLENIMLTAGLNPDRTPCYGYVKNKSGCYSVVTFSLKYGEAWEDSDGNLWIPKRIHPLGFWEVDPFEYKEDRLYDFWLEMNNKYGNVISLDISFMPSACYWPMGERVHHIELDAEEHTALLGKLDEHCRKFYGKSCAELLAEARKRMWPKDEEDMI